VDGDFGQWTMTLGWMVTLGWTATSGWPEIGWPVTLGSEVEGWRQGSSPETNVGRVDFFDFWKDPVLLIVFKFVYLYDVAYFNWML
jgi:hypothetical protein